MAFPRTPNEEELFAQMQRGTQAAASEAFYTPLMEQRRKDLTTAIVRRARSLDPDPAKKLSDRDCFVFVMALAAIADLEDHLKQVISDGQKAGQHFVK